MAIALNVSNNIVLKQNTRLLNQWPDAMLENIWTFNQCAGLGAPLQTAHDKAGKVYLQKEREYIARNLESAAIQLSQDLNYYVSPMYFSQTFPIGNGIPHYNQIFRGRWLKMIALGQRATSVIQAAATVTYSDPNNMGVNDTATITVNTTTANEEIRVYFRVADGAQAAGDCRFEVEPVTITDNGAGVVTIRGHRALFVKPSNWKREYTAGDPNFNSPNILDTSVVANFVTSVDIYRVYTDTTAAVETLSSTGAVLQGFTGDIIDYELSAFRLGYHCADYSCCDRPTQLRVHYYAGSPLINNNIDSELYEAVVALASANMPSELTGMSYWSLNNWLRWHGALMESASGGPIPVATSRQAKSMYGARAGQIKAWGVAMSRRLERGGAFF